MDPAPIPAQPQAFAAVAIAMGLGLLVGLQRERSESAIAGIRTVPLISVLGALCGLLVGTVGGWLTGVGLLGVIASTVIGNIARLRRGDAESGITTEITLLVMFALGVMVALMPEQREVPVAVGVGVAALLNAKVALHTFVAKMGEKDVRAVLQFAVITFIILPVLPNQSMGPYGTLNPHRTWLMVVLVTGISLAGYAAYKLVGQRTGAVLAGILGGSVSSTATTVYASRHARTLPASATISGLVITLASAVVFVRVLVEMAVVSPELLRAAALPIGVMMGVAALCAVVFWWVSNGDDTRLPEQENPSELKAALLFAAIYALVRLAAAAAQDQFGEAGLYAVACFAGIADMDAITLTSARMVKEGTIEPGFGWRVVVIASISNLVSKAIIAGALGGPRLLARVIVPFALIGAAGIALIFILP